MKGKFEDLADEIRIERQSKLKPPMSSERYTLRWLDEHPEAVPTFDISVQPEKTTSEMREEILQLRSELRLQKQMNRTAQAVVDALKRGR